VGAASITFVSLRRSRGSEGRVRLATIAAAAAIVLLAAPGTAFASVAVQATQFSAVEGQSFSGQVAKFSDTMTGMRPDQYTASIDWGDGTTSPGTVTAASVVAGQYSVTGSHTYAEEGQYVVTVNISTGYSATGSAQATETVRDAPLSIAVNGATEFAGTSASNSLTSAVSGFIAAIGGPDNGSVPTEHPNGYREINWDGVALDGSDPGSTVVVQGHVVTVSRDRMLPYGIELGRSVAVANDGFASVNPSLAGPPPLLSAYSAPNIFAPFNTNVVQMQIEQPSSGGTPVSQGTQALGIVFLNVTQSDTTSIQYYSNGSPIGQVYAPVSGPGGTSFVGERFPTADVTRVVVTLGTATIFNFTGSSYSSGPADDPTTGSNLVGADDIVLAEPTSSHASIQAAPGTPLSGVLDTFADTDPSGTLSDYSATVDWGDGTRTTGQIAAGPTGTFTVSGSHTFKTAGTYAVAVTVTDIGGASQVGGPVVQVGARPTSARLTCAKNPLPATVATACTATVVDNGAGSATPPKGRVFFGASTNAISFSTDSGCYLVPHNATTSSCSVQVIPETFPPRKAVLSVSYGGDDRVHAPSDASTSVHVRLARCEVAVPRQTITGRSRRITLVVSCETHAAVRIHASAFVSRRGGGFLLGRAGLIVQPGTTKRVTLRILVKHLGRRINALDARHADIRLHVRVRAKLRARTEALDFTAPRVTFR
jgi:hypothetical protein